MQTNNILQLGYLDILFSRRFKDYGAYELRSNYSRRVKKALVVCILASTTLFSVVLYYLAINPRVIPDIIFDAGNGHILKQIHPINPPLTFITPITAPIDPNAYQVIEDKDINNRDIEDDIPTNPLPGNPGEGNPGPVISGGGGGTSTEGEDPIILIPKDPVPNIVTTETYSNGDLDIDPEFPGGEDKFIEKISSLLKYPTDALEDNHSEVVLVEFIIDETGSVSNVKSIKGEYKSCKLEAERVMRLVPKWKPGRLGGKAVKSIFKVPICFVIEG